MTDLVGHRIGAESPPLQLLTSYMRSLATQALPATPELGRAIVGHVHELMALTISSAFDGRAFLREPSVAAARLQAVKDDIAGNLTSAELSGPALAARHRMTPRHLRRLFETEGTTFSAYVLSHRLARAHDMLTSPRFAPYGIAAIAYECGFNDVSYFNLAFRRAYAGRPSEIRAAALALLPAGAAQQA
jgi:transcriptional regulator GlxA family with amidase domain